MMTAKRVGEKGMGFGSTKGQRFVFSPQTQHLSEAQLASYPFATGSYYPKDKVAED
jgi:hypothetical protein